jgi:hypothetical protein
MQVSTQHDVDLAVVNTHPQLVKCAVSQCVWRDENGEFLRSTTVAEGMCEYGGACSWSVVLATCSWWFFRYLEDSHQT